MLIVQAIRSRRHGRTNGGAVFHQSNSDALEILQKPVVIEGERADDIRTTGESDDADAIIWSAFDKLACHFANGVDAGGRFAADSKILR